MPNSVMYNNIIATHPGGFIESFLEDVGMTVEELSQKSNININLLKQFINGEIEVNEEIANKLYPVTGIAPYMLISFQDLYYNKLEEIKELKDKVNSKLFSTVIYILEQFKELSTMQIQKLTYYVQAWSLVFLGYPLFEENFQAWANGPVCPELYKFHVKRFSLSIEDMIDIEPPKLNDEEKKIINAVIKRYGKMTGQELSDLTHKERPWFEARGNTPIGEKSTAIISKDVMQDYYGAFSKAMYKYLTDEKNNYKLCWNYIQENIKYLDKSENDYLFYFNNPQQYKENFENLSKFYLYENFSRTTSLVSLLEKLLKMNENNDKIESNKFAIKL